ncbi:MAG: tRNA guanosine(34) transglycosylase Tgt [Nanoarchaeota archaeon]|nr:tRNA guanosine(34) transglycosylase Tgt [Nanoarchaeota archaeon]
MKKFFQIIKKDKASMARTGIITTPHGKVETPVFMVVGTKATVKAIGPDDLKSIGAQIVLANTYHLHLAPGERLIRDKFGGMRGFMGWDGPMITDSGGFQVFSLGFGMEHNIGKMGNIFPEESRKKKKDNVEQLEKFAKIDEKGVTFKSPIDGKTDRLTPEKSIRIQEDLGADIILAFDECTSPLHDHEYTKKALLRTHRWAKECIRAKKNNDQSLFGIIQGGAFEDLRKMSAEFFAKQDFRGYAIGGSLGKSKHEMHRILDWTIPLLPEEKPIHLLGIGAVEDIFEAVERGIDMFDCISPTRLARSGYLLVPPSEGGKKENKYRINIKNTVNRTSTRTIDKTCDCYTCRNFSRAYLRHLCTSDELLYHRLGSIHNLRFLMRLMKDIREAIKKDKFQELKKKWVC